MHFFNWVISKDYKTLLKNGTFNQSKVTEIVPVCLPNGQVDYTNRDSWGTGWGTLFSGGSVSRYLQEVKMPFLSDARCKQKFGSAADISVHVCAGENGEGKDTCQGRVEALKIKLKFCVCI